MWHTSRGDRTLDGHEAVLVSKAIDVMVGALLVHIDEEFEDSAPDCETGIAIYDMCTPSQRIGLLHEVAKYLLTSTDEPLALSALTDATVAAIFVEIRDQIAIEIEFAASHEDSGQPQWREMVLAAHRSIYSNNCGECVRPGIRIVGPGNSMLRRTIFATGKRWSTSWSTAFSGIGTLRWRKVFSISIREFHGSVAVCWELMTSILRASHPTQARAGLSVGFANSRHCPNEASLDPISLALQID